MSYHRVIPVLLYDNGAVYRSQQFARHYRLGDPLAQLDRYKAWDVDEIIYLDMHRTEGGRRLMQDLPDIGRNCFAPLAVGGGISSLDDIHRHLDAGADRVVINSAAIDNPEFITEAAERYGAQAIVVSIDAVLHADGHYEVVAASGRQPTGLAPDDWAAEAASRGAGEIFINSVNRDGMGGGYDIKLIRSVAARISIPLIACGGVGRIEDFAVGIAEGHAASVAAANIFAFSELSYPLAKDTLLQNGVSVRASSLSPPARRRTTHTV